MHYPLSHDTTNTYLNPTTENGNHHLSNLRAAVRRLKTAALSRYKWEMLTQIGITGRFVKHNIILLQINIVKYIIETVNFIVSHEVNKCVILEYMVILHSK